MFKCFQTKKSKRGPIAEIECFKVDCRQIAIELKCDDIVDLIDASHGHVWPEADGGPLYEERKRVGLDDKLRAHGLYFESDDEQFMEEPEPPPSTEPEEEDEKKKKSRQSVSHLDETRPKDTPASECSNMTIDHLCQCRHNQQLNCFIVLLSN